MQPNLPSFVELQFSRFNNKEAVTLLILVRNGAKLEVWVRPDWTERLDPQDQSYLSHLMQEWKTAAPAEIPALLDELSRQSHGPLRVSNSGRLPADECQGLIDRFLAPRR
jgi:hypothetical protein